MGLIFSGWGGAAGTVIVLLHDGHSISAPAADASTESSWLQWLHLKTMSIGVCRKNGEEGGRGKGKFSMLACCDDLLLLLSTFRLTLSS